MPKGNKRKKQTADSAAAAPVAKRQATRSSTANDLEHIQANPVELVDLGVSESDTGGKSGTSKHIVDFEQLIEESNLLGPQKQTKVQTGLANINFEYKEEVVSLGSDDLSAHVPIQICEKIRDNKYINLTLLLKGIIELHDLFSGGLIHLTETDTFEARPKITREKIPDTDKWTGAFLIFSSIYLQKHPNKAQEFLQYMAIVRDANARHGGLLFRNYDEQFRLRQAI